MILTELAQITLTLGGAAQAITTTILPVEAVFITAASTNSGSIYIGSSSVSSTRFVKKLAAGGEFSIAVSPSGENDSANIKLQSIYFDGTTGDKINVGYMINQP